VVAVGFTACVPPVAGRVYELPSDPVTETCVALVALTESVDELPGVIAEGLAVTLTVGGGLVELATVTVAVAEMGPETPVAIEVYVVVLAGLTACVPPVELSRYELPSDPVTVTAEALAAVTVSVDEAPAPMDGGDATMLTVAGFTMLTWLEPQPATTNANRRLPTRYERNWREILDKCAESKVSTPFCRSKKAHRFLEALRAIGTQSVRPRAAGFPDQ
jgi:hypothetical protein